MPSPKRVRREERLESQAGGFVWVSGADVINARLHKGRSVNGLGVALAKKGFTCARQKIQNVEQGRARRQRRGFVEALAVELGVPASRLILEHPDAPNGAPNYGAQVRADSLAKELERLDSAVLTRDALTALFDFDVAHHAVGRSMLALNDRRIPQWREDFARAMDKAVRTLLAPLVDRVRDDDHQVWHEFDRFLTQAARAVATRRDARLDQSDGGRFDAGPIVEEVTRQSRPVARARRSK